MCREIESLLLFVRKRTNYFFPQIVRDASSTNTLGRIEEYISPQEWGEKFQFHRFWLNEEPKVDSVHACTTTCLAQLHHSIKFSIVY